MGSLAIGLLSQQLVEKLCSAALQAARAELKLGATTGAQMEMRFTAAIHPVFQQAAKVLNL